MISSHTFNEIKTYIYYNYNYTYNLRDDKSTRTAVFQSCRRRYTVYLVVDHVIPQPGEQSIGALSVRLCLVSEIEISKIGRRVFGAVDHQTMALTVVRVK